MSLANANTMARHTQPNAPATATYTVLRALCMHGHRVEVGDPVEMTPLQYAEAHNAGKVGPFVSKPAAKVAKPNPDTTPTEDAPK